MIHITVNAVDRALILLVEGRLDGVSSPTFRDKIMALIDEGNNALVIDCAMLTYVSSAGLRVFYQTAAKLEPRGGKLLFCRPSEAVKRVFDMVEMGADFRIFPTRDEALASLK